MEPNKVLEEIASQVSNCTNCALHFSRKNGVPGEGPVQVEVMLIGEGPGFYENEQGRPFVGAAGKFLDELLEQGGLKRSDVYITNVVKCRPPSNRDPLPEELEACRPYLERQLDILQPRVIVTLGRYSMATFIPNVRISDVHGHARWVRGRLVVPMYHPAAALHQPSLRAGIEKDFAQLPKWIVQARNASAQATPVVEKPDSIQPTPTEDSKSDSSSPTQLNLF